MARSSQLTTAIVSLVLLLGLQDAYGMAPKRNLDVGDTPSPSPSPRTCGENFDCTEKAGVRDVRKAADTVTAGDTEASRGGTPAECCEALVPGTCGNNFDCSGEETNTISKAADTPTADTPGTANECCEPQTYVGEASVTISGITLDVANSDAFKGAFKESIAEQYNGVSSSDVTIGTIVEGRRRLSGGVTIPYTITTTDASVAQAALTVNLQMSSLGIKITETCGTDGCGSISGLQVDSKTEFQEVKADEDGSATPTAAAGAATATLLLVLFANI